jgi:hypothetical protein
MMKGKAMRAKYLWIRISLGLSVLAVTLWLTGSPVISEEKTS